MDVLFFQIIKIPSFFLRTQKIFIGGFIQLHMVVICIWCALFVTSQFDVMFILSSEVC